MNEPLSFGAPERRRFEVRFGYDVRPSFWQNVQSNAHLVIAAVGTVALLGVAGVALWLALPASDRQIVASAAQIVPAIPVKTTKVTPVIASAAAVKVAAAPQAAPKGDAVSAIAPARATAIPALSPNDPRWSAAGAKVAAAPTATAPAPSQQAATKPSDQAGNGSAAAFAEAENKNDASAALSDIASGTADNEAAADKTATDNMDSAQTAAIPAPKPQAPAADDQAKADSQSATATGRILQAVTMRTGPKQKAAAMITVPAKTSVQVIGCKKWCEIVYNGKRGWIYKSFIKTGT